MATLQYVTALKSGSIMEAPCTATGTDNIGVELAITAQNLVGGLEHLRGIVLKIEQGNFALHSWSKGYNHYMRAGTMYTFSSATNFRLPAGTYKIGYAVISDGVDAGTLPLVPEYDSIPVVY